MVWQNDIFLLTPGIIKLTYDGIPMDTTPKPGSYCHVYFSKRIIKQGVVTVASTEVRRPSQKTKTKDRETDRQLDRQTEKQKERLKDFSAYSPKHVQNVN